MICALPPKVRAKHDCLFISAWFAGSDNVELLTYLRDARTAGLAKQRCGIRHVGQRQLWVNPDTLQTSILLPLIQTAANVA